MSEYIIPTYKKIALDLAKKIQDGAIKEGDILYGRSSLASTYNVSPETIRRSIILLEDVEVVQTVKGKGIFVISAENAKDFSKTHNSINTIKKFKTDIDSMLIEKAKLESKINELITSVIDYSSRFKEESTIPIIEFTVPSDCIHIDKTFAELKFWQNTGATLVAVRRDNQTILSPGPYLIVSANDILVVVGDTSVSETVPKFLNSPL